jgi:enoyl-CoA hydratase/carnithine racemase
MTQHILTETHDGVLRIAFNRPDKKNALTFDMYRALSAALDSASADAQVRVALIHGTPDAFTAGNDLADFLGGEFSEDSPTAVFLKKLLAFDKPLVAAVGGVAVGIGSTLLLHCDLVYCASNARFAFPFVNLGVVPEAASSYLLPRLAGWQRAAELFMLGEPFDAQRAREAGLVNEIVAPEQLMDTALAAALKLAQKPPAALRLTKALMKQSHAAPAAAAMEEELKVFRAQLRSPEAKEAMTAFFEKRKPDFSRFS